MIQFDVNNKKFQTIDEAEKNNIGLKNVSNRLDLIYPRSHELRIFNEKDNFSIELRVYNKEENLIHQFGI